MDRQLFEEVLKDGTEPLDIMDAEAGLRKLVELTAPRNTPGEQP